ncbi:TonB-dependent receptor [Maribellus luteus]|uniref:TonB-dependent receptor n=1 Tax=Maribellus luteus TaxID=2305463 RepID=A0A399T4K0_9BACT|nr:TonB-dependent receptor [Maribellus luteus]RIJ50818.1 TonB-dependent receptor [Maribellus luteus]
MKKERDLKVAYCCVLRFGLNSYRFLRLFSLIIILFSLSYFQAMAGEFNSQQVRGVKQVHTIKGKVTDLSGEFLPGVTVVIKGTTQGTVTNTDGEYSISDIEQGAYIVFSFVGMKTKEILFSGQLQVDVVMEQEAIGLEEVVAIGYGTQKKKEITSSIANVTKDDFNQGAIVSSPLQLVQGKVAGLAIQRVNGDPNKDVSIQLRGISTVSGNSEPLVIIDGFPGGNLNSIAPEDIESIDVLRDGSAAAIYGTRGTNGVIIVTTKKGEEGKMRVEYSGYVTYETSKLPDMLSATEFKDLAQEYISSSNPEKQAKGSSMVDYGGDTDWFEEMTQDPVSMVHHLSVSGGNNKTIYAASLNYREIEGVMKRSGQNMLKSHLNISHSTLDDRLNVSFNLSANTGNYSPTDYSLYSHALKRNPTLPVYNEDGTFYETYAWEDFNPVGMIYQTDQDNQMTQLLGNTRISYEIVEGLKATVMGAIQKNHVLKGYYDYKESSHSVIGGYNGRASRNYDQALDRNIEFTLNYSKVIEEVHRLDVLGGYSYEDFTNEGFYAGNSNFITDQYKYNNIGAGDYLLDGMASMSSYKNSSKLISFFGRGIYSYKDKYLLTVGVRRDGSSKFGKNNKWGWFPSVSAGWRVSEEEFMSSVGWLDNMKLRIGYGVTGNQGTNPYASLVRLQSGPRMLYNGSWIPGVVPASNPNPDLRWETKHELNFGLDFSVFNNRVNANIDVYNRLTKDLIYTYSVPTPPNIYNQTTTNVGEMQNRGIELSINALPIQKKDFTWTIDFNISYNKNKLVSLSNEQYPFSYKDILTINTYGLSGVPTYRLEEGQPIGNMFGYIFAGFTDQGKWLVENKDGEVIPITDATADDKKVMGNGLPKIHSGITNTFAYKNFDFSFMLRGAFMYDIYNLLSLTHNNAYQLPINVLSSAKDIELFDLPSYNSYNVENGGFLKLSNVTLGYSFNLNNNLLNKARIYISGQDLYTITKYTGVDPELEINGLGPGFDGRNNYPRSKTFTFGVNLTF